MGGSKMMNLSQRDKTLLAFLIIILLGCGFYFLAYAPVNKEIKTLTNANKELQIEKDQLQLQIENVAAHPPAVQEEEENIDNRLPVDDEMIPFLIMLDDTLGKYNLPFTSLDYKGTENTPDGNAKVMTFTIATTGKLIPFLDFINDLEETERLISIEDVSFNGVKAEQAQDVSEAEAEPPAYYIAPPGIPEGKLQRIKFEIVDAPEESSTDTERPVAESFKQDVFDMRVTIKAYYSGLNTTTPEKTKDDTNADNSETEGAV